MTLIGATITGALDLRRAAVPCSLALDQCYFESAPSLAGATIPALSLRGSHAPGLSLDGARIDGDAFLTGLHTTGEVRALGAHIGGQLALGEAVLMNEDGFALSLDRAHIDGGAFLTGLHATGEVRALGAHIGGQLDMQGEAILISKDGFALSLDGARIDGGAFLAGLHATGEVRALGAHIGGQLDMQGEAILTNKGGTALGLDGARIDGDAFLAGLHATGEVRANGAHIDGQFDLRSVTITGANGEFSGSTMKVDTLLLGADWEIGGTVYLGRAAIGTLIIDDTLSTGNLMADGWHVEALQPFGSLDEKAMRGVMTTWLSTAKDFTPQPWHEVADVFERQGRPTDARTLRVKAAWLTTARAPWWATLARVAYGALVGHGHRPLRAGWWLVGSLALAAILTWGNAESFAPTNPAALQANLTATATPAGAQGAPALSAITVTGTTSCRELDRAYPCLKPWQYAFDVVLPPTLSTGQASTWRTTTTWLALTFQGLRILAWLLITLLVAGVTGLLRKT